MIKILDKAQVGTDTFVVQKVVKPDGTFLRYQVGIPGHSESFTEHKELESARRAIGKYPAATVVKRKPKAKVHAA